MGVMLMAASRTELTLIGDGTDEEDEMLSELKQMFEDKFGEAQ